MTPLEVILTAFGLSMDAFSVALAAAATGFAARPRPAFRLAFHFGLFQALMPIAGWALGVQADVWVRPWDHWVAFGLLAVVGGRMIRESFAPDGGRTRTDPSRGLTLVLLSVATSIDALAVGFSLAMLRVEIWGPSVTIGVITGAMALMGIGLGTRVGPLLGRRMELAGGVVLILIGARIVMTHLLAG